MIALDVNGNVRVGNFDGGPVYICLLFGSIVGLIGLSVVVSLRRFSVQVGNERVLGKVVASYPNT